MIGGRARGAAAAGAFALALVAAASPGCCLTGRGTSSRENRDTPAAAFAYVRAAFAEDRTGDEFESFHQDFTERQGFGKTTWAFARDVRPGIFARAAELLGKAELVSVEDAGTVTTARGPRAAVRVTLVTGEGGRGVFLLADEPKMRVWTDDEGLGPVPLYLPDMDRRVRVEEGRLVVGFEAASDYLPDPGTRVRRVEVHHDWLLYDVRELEGFDDLLREVREASEETRAKGKEERPQ